MGINDYIKENDLPEMKILGKMKVFTYYIEKNLSNEDVGIPMIIAENTKKHTFSVCNADQALDIMRYFNES